MNWQRPSLESGPFLQVGTEDAETRGHPLNLYIVKYLRQRSLTRGVGRQHCILVIPVFHFNSDKLEGNHVQYKLVFRNFLLRSKSLPQAICLPPSLPSVQLLWSWGWLHLQALAQLSQSIHKSFKTQHLLWPLPIQPTFAGLHNRGETHNGLEATQLSQGLKLWALVFLSTHQNCCDN